MCFSLIEARKISWTEAATLMSIDDVIDLHEACNAIASGMSAPITDLED